MAPNTIQKPQLRSTPGRRNNANSNVKMTRSHSCVTPPVCPPPSTENQPARRHSKIEVVSCFRSTGSVPVPKCKSGVFGFVPSIPKKKPKINEHSWEESPHIEEGEIKLIPKIHSVKANVIDNIDNQIGETATKTETPKIKIDLLPEVIEPPPPPPTKKNNCKKHSKCHCDLFSKDLDNFFNITIK